MHSNRQERLIMAPGRLLLAVLAIAILALMPASPADRAHAGEMLSVQMQSAPVSGSHAQNSHAHLVLCCTALLTDMASLPLNWRVYSGHERLAIVALTLQKQPTKLFRPPRFI